MIARPKRRILSHSSLSRQQPRFTDQAPLLIELTPSLTRTGFRFEQFVREHQPRQFVQSVHLAPLGLVQAVENLKGLVHKAKESWRIDFSRFLLK
jgi:hypothetical protein